MGFDTIEINLVMHKKLQINLLLLEILRTNLFHALGQSSAKGIK